MLLSDGELQRYADSDPEYNQDIVAMAKELSFYRDYFKRSYFKLVDDGNKYFFEWKEKEYHAPL